MQSYAESVSQAAGVKASTLSDSVSGTLDVASYAGLVHVRGSAAGFVKLPAASGDPAKAVGVSVCDPMTPVATTGEDFAAGREIELLERGEIWCVCEEAMAVDTQPYVRHTANGAGKLQCGALRSDADTAHAELLPNARVVYPSTGAGIVKISLNLPYGASS